ncbi:MAG: cadherin-like beta sandwich domain-containing protein [Ruminococcus sp.]|nr:cadherin-like beta sandwich domain-containing protein [Ruminococcus sp.]
MKRLSKKIISLALVTALMTTFMSFSFVSSAARDEKVRVIVRNDVFSVEDGAAWDGVLVDEWVDIDESTTMISAVVTALDNHGYTQSGAESNYITEVNGLSAFDGGFMGGWMCTLNDWFTDQGFGAYTVADGTLENGDEISIMYTMAWGEDIGSSWSNNDIYLADITFSDGVLNEDFDPEVNDYTLTIPADTESVIVTPTAYNKNYQVRTYLNDYTPAENGTEYKRSADIPVSEGDKIIVGVGDEAWPSMNYTSGANVYTFTIKVEEKAETVDEKIKSTSDYFLTLNTPVVASVGGDWLTLGLARNSLISDEFAEGYYNNVVEYVKSIGSSKLDGVRSTENSRVILGLTSIGKDVTDVGGYNLLEPLADFNYLIKQGINGPIWALIAIDSNNYEIPIDNTVSEQTTRELLIETILSLQLENGGWAFFGNTADPDMTGMAIQSLAKYYGKNDDVTDAIDKAINKMSELQSDDGVFKSWGSANVESCAQIVVALTSVGINPTTDERFVKNGNSLIDALMSFSVENGFKHTINGKYDQMATEQAFYALVSYKRLIDGQTSLYDMTDIFEKTYVAYDVNLDGIVTIDDVTLIQKYMAELEELDEIQVKIADCDEDGKITIDDATLIQKFLVDLI